MAILPHKLTFQLTPLLDLLLIVIFAQYMEVQNTGQKTDQESRNRIAAAETQLSDSQQSIAELRERQQQDLQNFNNTTLQIEQAAAKERMESARRVMELARGLEQAIQQRDLVGDLVSELFQIPDEIIVEILTPRSPAENIRTPQEIEELRAKFRMMKRLPGNEIAKHLLTYVELRKRCDIWDVYVAANGVTTFSIGKDIYRFRANTSEDFQRILFERYKTSPQPKSLVIILLSYGDTRAVTYEAAVDGLPRAADRMRADSNTRTRFEYAILGYNPQRAEQ